MNVFKSAVLLQWKDVMETNDEATVTDIKEKLQVFLMEPRNSKKSAYYPFAAFTQFCFQHNALLVFSSFLTRL